MRYLLILIIIVSGIICSCSNEQIPVLEANWVDHVPLNKNDSTIMISIYKGLGYDNWPRKYKDKIDFRYYRSWINNGCTLQEIDGEMRIYYIDFSWLDFLNGEILNLPNGIGKLIYLRSIIINTGKASPSIKIPDELFDCPLAYLALEGEGFYGSIPSSIKCIQFIGKAYYCQHPHF